MPCVSIIVPVYNVELYIHRCIDSILAQTFTDFELILVDDGSPDNCPTICDEYAEKDGRIFVIHKKNGGLSSARNAGMKVATGKYVLFCDSDDYVDPQWCEAMVNVAEQEPSAVVVSGVRNLFSDLPVECVKKLSEAISVTYYGLFKAGVSGYSVNKVYRKSILDELKLYFDETCRYAEDVGFNVSYCSAVGKYIFIDSPLYNYVRTQESITSRYYENTFELFLNPFYCRIPLISDADLPEYCDTWLYQFLKLFDNVFDTRCTMGFWKKMRYNQRMIRTPEFTFCLEHASGKNESKLFMRILRLRNYYLLWLFNKLVSLKSKLTR